MPAPPEIVNLSKQYIAENIVPLLPEEVGALCLEINAWHIQVHTYQIKVFSEQEPEALDAAVSDLASDLPARDGEPWQSTLTSHRCDPGELPPYEGEVVYERWNEL
jgi:hypothetical protein